MWGMVAKVAMNMVQGAQATKAAARQNVAQNKMIQQYNKKVMINTMEQVTQLNLQRAQQRQETTAALYNVGLQKQAATDAVTTQAAATETIGASVSDAVATVNQKAGQAQGMAQDQFVRAMDQSNEMLRKTISQGKESLRDPASTRDIMAPMNNAIWSSIGSVAGQAAGRLDANAEASDQMAEGAKTEQSQFDYWGSGGNSQNPFGLQFGFSGSNLLK